MSTKTLGLNIKHYKCFGEDTGLIDDLKRINILVGRNNSGKSAVIDAIGLICDFKPPDDLHRHKGGKGAEIEIARPLNEQELKRIFSDGSAHGPIPGNHWDFGKQLIGKKAIFRLEKGAVNFLGIEGEQLNQDPASMIRQYLRNPTVNPLHGKRFRRLSADRDIVPEVDNNEFLINSNGTGFTNAVQRYLNKSYLPSEIIEGEMLAGLNEIFSPDAQFMAIAVQQHGTNHWEVFLREQHKGLISLSNSGSGLKTVLLVLGLFICVPDMDKAGLNDYFFAFEELENNLHPALQRRLVEYIRKKCRTAGCMAALTTHSSAIIDFFSHDDDTQILHVSHTGISASVRRVTTYIHNRGVLDDLDVRASDLLQANAIVWVEGPSDRLYVNHWLEIFTNGRLKEGFHYQCVFYGGRLLAHLSGDAPDEGSDEAVRILSVNRNAIILIDSDKRAETTEINATKQRMITSVSNTGGFAWVTKGKEIENYISQALLQKRFPNIGALKQYDDIEQFLDNWKSGEGKKFKANKVVFAEQIVTGAKNDDWKGSLDLEGRIADVAKAIARWNGVNLSA